MPELSVVSTNPPIYKESNEPYLLDNIIGCLDKYDIYDFISRIAVLSLLPMNQNKDYVFDEIIDRVLQNNIDYYTGTNTMSVGKLKQIVNQVFYNEKHLLDPIEYPFVQRIRFYGNKIIFNGRNPDVGYRLQMLIDSVFLHSNEYDLSFKDDIRRMLEVLLDISTIISERLDIDAVESLHLYSNDKIIFLSSSDVDKYNSAIRFSINDFSPLIGKKIETLFTDFGCCPSGLSDNYSFYKHPFLKTSEDEFICLNPTMISAFAISYVLKLAKQYNILKTIFEKYNDTVWNDCRKSIRDLGHFKIKASDVGIELVNKSYYRDMIFTAYNDGALIFIMVSDDGNNYDVDSFYSSADYDCSLIKKRMSELTELLSAKSSFDKIYTVIITNSLERYIDTRIDISTKKYAVMSPFQFKCVSINERQNNNFLVHYLDIKKELNFYEGLYVNDYNYISFYASNRYSFYTSDDIDSKTLTLVIGLDDAIEYTIKAIKKEDKQLVEDPTLGVLSEVVLHDKERKIYCLASCNSLNLLVKLSNISIWITCDKPKTKAELSVSYSVVDLISYWLGELRNEIEKWEFKTNHIVVENTYKDDVEKYFYDTNISDEPISKLVDMDCCGDGKIIIKWTAEAFCSIGLRKNNGEKELLQALLEKIASYKKDKLDVFSLAAYFADPLKHKMIIYDCQACPYLKPTSTQFIRISKQAEETILDKIGQHFIEMGYKPGVIESDKRRDICNKIVSFLYNELVAIVKKLRIKEMLHALCYDYEIIINNVMTFQRLFSSQLACYPEARQELMSTFNDLNRSSIAIKFLLEYCGSVGSDGKTLIGEKEYEFLLALCVQIVDWAYTSDLFSYNIIDEELSLLESNRIGFNKERVNYLYSKHQKAYSNKLLYDSNPNKDRFVPIEPYPDFLQELDPAFFKEYGYTFSDFCNCINRIVDIGDAIDSDVKEYDYHELIADLEKSFSIDRKTVISIIKDCTILKRSDYLKVPKPFDKEDVYPWRNNRRLSFNRRPIISIDNKLVWGNRQLFHSLMFTYELICTGKFKAASLEMKQLVSRIANYQGGAFNNDVADKIRSLGYSKVYTKVKKINKKKISNDNNTLGDIDVLLINPAKRRIIVIETKDFSFSRNPHEIELEYRKLFCDSEKSVSYITKHKRRVEWVKAHIEDLKIQYRLEGVGWKVTNAFVVNEPIVSNYYHCNSNKVIIPISELNRKKIEKL